MVGLPRNFISERKEGRVVPMSGKLEGRSVSDRSQQGARVLTSSSPTASGCTLPVSDAMRSVQVLDDGLRLVPKGKRR